MNLKNPDILIEKETGVKVKETKEYEMNQPIGTFSSDIHLKLEKWMIDRIVLENNHSVYKLPKENSKVIIGRRSNEEDRETFDNIETTFDTKVYEVSRKTKK